MALSAAAVPSWTGFGNARGGPGASGGDEARRATGHKPVIVVIGPSGHRVQGRIGLHARRQHGQIDRDLLERPGGGVFHLEDEVLRCRVFFDLGHLALEENDVLVVLDGSIEIFEPVDRPDVDIEDVDLRIGVLFPDVGGLLHGSQAADGGAKREMVFVAGTGALDESDGLGCRAVGGTDDLPLGRAVGRRKAFHHHVGDYVPGLAEPVGVEFGGVVGGPAGGPDDGAHLEIDRSWRTYRVLWRHTDMLL